MAQRLKQIWDQPDAETARRYAHLLIEEYTQAFPEAMEILENGLEDSLQQYAFGQFDARRIRSTNVLERLHKEIRHRSRVVAPFPSLAAYLRLITCYLIEYTEDWSTDRAYISAQKIAAQAAMITCAA